MKRLCLMHAMLMPLLTLYRPPVSACPGEAAKLFTHLLLLTSDGRIAYHGPMAGALDYFATLG